MRILHYTYLIIEHLFTLSKIFILLHVKNILHSKRQSFLNPLKEDNENYFQLSPTASTDNVSKSNILITYIEFFKDITNYFYFEIL